MQWNVDEIEDVVSTKVTTDMDLVDDIIPDTPTKPEKSVTLLNVLLYRCFCSAFFSSSP
jgi:hypothetical protein